MIQKSDLKSLDTLNNNLSTGSNQHEKLLYNFLKTESYMRFEQLEH